MRNFLIDKIKDRKLTGQIDMEKKISEKMLITEYWRYWLTLPDKDNLKRIYSYPTLTYLSSYNNTPLPKPYN